MNLLILSLTLLLFFVFGIIIYYINKKNEVVLDYIYMINKKYKDDDKYDDKDDRMLYRYSQNHNKDNKDNLENKHKRQEIEKENNCVKEETVKENVVYYYPQYPNPWLINRNLYYDNFYDRAGGYDLYSYNNPYHRHNRHRNNGNENNNENIGNNKILINNTIQSPPPMPSTTLPPSPPSHPSISQISQKDFILIENKDEMIKEKK